MIGVIADQAEHDAVREFFELFKTPWEFYRRGRRYDVLLCTGEGEFDESAPLVVLYAGSKTRFDGQRGAAAGRERIQPCLLLYQSGRIPIYGRSVTFETKAGCLLVEESSDEAAAYLDQSGGRIRARIGYDLFREIRSLLTVGQPPANASLPTLELHIEVLRDLITACGVSVVEIPPVPQGYGFIACLTHDVDHPSLRRHKWDTTTIGFLFRAVFESCWNLLRGHASFRDLLQNWVAAVKVPFVHLGLAKDFWSDFADRYLELEKGLSSTFFVIPFSNRPGRSVDGHAPRRRAAGYGARDVADMIRKLVASGNEVGLHGIDAWLESSAAREELEEIRALTGIHETGARMHWLYCNEESPGVLEKAGVAYDSSIGYNETVGYRAGTTQAYKPLEANHMLELPMHVMDTALFYHSYLGLTQREARKLVESMIENTAGFGGCLTVNWHDRSLAPERLWGDCYQDMLQALKARRAWFATAGQVVSWFRMRRSVVFESDSLQTGAARIKFVAPDGGNLPGLMLRRHRAALPGDPIGRGPEKFVDLPIEQHVALAVSSPVEQGA